MAQLDAATQLFIDKVAEDAFKNHDGERAALGYAKKLVNLGADPKRTITRALVGAATKELIKEGSMGVIRIYDILNDSYHKTWWDWEPETIWQSLVNDHGVDATRELKDLIMALQVIVTSDFAFEDWNVFEKVTCALNHNAVDFYIIQPPEMDEVAFSVAVLKHIRGETTAYEDEVLGYIAACAKTSGIVWLPPELYPARAQEFLDGLNNDLGLKEKVKSRKDDGSPAFKIQILQLKEIAEYVLGQKRD